MEEPELLRPCEVAARLGMSSKHVRKLLRERALPGVRQGGIWLIPRKSLEAYLQRLRERADQHVRA